MSKILILGTLNDNEISCLRKNSEGKFCQRLKLLHRTVKSEALLLPYDRAAYLPTP